MGDVLGSRESIGQAEALRLVRDRFESRWLLPPARASHRDHGYPHRALMELLWLTYYCGGASPGTGPLKLIATKLVPAAPYTTLVVGSTCGVKVTDSGPFKPATATV